MVGGGVSPVHAHCTLDKHLTQGYLSGQTTRPPLHVILVFLSTNLRVVVVPITNHNLRYDISKCVDRNGHWSVGRCPLDGVGGNEDHFLDSSYVTKLYKSRENGNKMK